MNLERTFFDELAALGLPAAPETTEPVTEADLRPLPEPAQRYMRFMRVVGRQRDWSFRMHVEGRFKMGQKASWKPCEIWQYDSAVTVARVFFMRLRFAGLLPVIARDTYLDGRGRMIGKLFDRFAVVDGRGEELDIGELVTYLNDLVLFAPSMLLQPAVSSREIDADSFELSLTDGGQTVTGRVFVDERGGPVDFETTDRFREDPVTKKMVRTRWTTPVRDYRETAGRMLPTSARAVWHPPEGSFAYAELEVDPREVVFNVPPGR